MIKLYSLGLVCVGPSGPYLRAWLIPVSLARYDKEYFYTLPEWDVSPWQGHTLPPLPSTRLHTWAMWVLQESWSRTQSREPGQGLSFEALFIKGINAKQPPESRG